MGCTGDRESRVRTGEWQAKELAVAPGAWSCHHGALLIWGTSPLLRGTYTHLPSQWVVCRSGHCGHSPMVSTIQRGGQCPA